MVSVYKELGDTVLKEYGTDMLEEFVHVIRIIEDYKLERHLDDKSLQFYIKGAIWWGKEDALMLVYEDDRKDSRHYRTFILQMDIDKNEVMSTHMVALGKRRLIRNLKECETFNKFSQNHLKLEKAHRI